jgi:putative ABC transport system permease protein
MTPSSTTDRRTTGLGLVEIGKLAYLTFAAYKVRFGLTALGMTIGTASLILVVTIALTGKDYVLRQIEAVGANMIEAYYAGGSNQAAARSDFLTLEDIGAVQREVPGIMYSSPMFKLKTAIGLGGKQRDIAVLGVSPDYRQIRNLQLLSGRFFGPPDRQEHDKTALVVEKLAIGMYGSPDAAIGQTIKLFALPFVVVGTFREGVETFGQSEITDDTVLIPDTVARYFTGSDLIETAYFSVADSSSVPGATEQIRQVLQSRHRPGSVYSVVNLTELLGVAAKAANALTAVLLLVSTVTLIVSGVGIMNIMLSTVNARVREIGVRKAVGATRREIRYQFLCEAAMIALAGGVVGIGVGLLIPLSLRWFAGFRIPISGLSAIIAIFVSSLVGIVFGTAPAARAANLDPVECLHYE